MKVFIHKMFKTALKKYCSIASVVSDSATPRTIACQAPLSMGYSWQEYWSGLPFLPNPEIKSCISWTADGFLTSEPPGKPPKILTIYIWTTSCLPDDIIC